MQAGIETVYGEAFRSGFSDSEQPEWLKKIREDAYAFFAGNGFPTTRNEEWKYTDVREVAAGEWPLSGKPSAAIGKPLAVSGRNRVVFVDGVFNEELTKTNDLPKGVRLRSFSDSYDEEAFKANFSKIVEADYNAFTALNTAFSEQGVFIEVEKNVKIEETIHVIFVGVNETANFPRILYVGGEGSEAEIVEHYTRTSDTAYFTNAVTEIVLEPNSRLVHTRVQRESHKAFHVGCSKALLARDAVYDNTNINLGARLARHDANLEYAGENAEAWIDGLYLVEDGQHMDTHSRIDHKVKNCTSHQNYKGILDGKSRAVFNGKVFVHENASGTDAEQSNKNLLLSNEAQVDTKPQLEIFNDDVKCAHGATVGQLEEEELFYLLSRGLDEDLAKNLLTYGFAEEIINKITLPEIKEQLDEAVLNRLQARLG